jgi:hypothetical protein
MRRCASLLALVLLLLPLLGCSDSFWDEENDIVVINDSSCRLTIFVDGWEAFTVRPDTTRTVNDVGRGRHTLEAVDDDDRLIERRTVDLGRSEDYYWYIKHCR